MITRMWRGWTRAADADAYQRFLLEDLFPSMRDIDGFLSADVLRRRDGDEEAFVTLTRFASLDAIRAFAGDDYERPVLEPRARELLSRHEEHADHFDTASFEATLHTKQLSPEPEAEAPDGSHVRLLTATSRGSMAHFEIGPGQTSKAVRHRTVEEVWYFVAGRGEMWRRSADGEVSYADVSAGVSINIPVGTAFQFRTVGDEPLAAVGTTMPPWPNDEAEAVAVEGPWPPT